MIEFRVDTTSGVAPYRQIVEQVRQGLRLGLLHVGDQLPTVKEVVAMVAINPNTVSKAYSRAGVGRARGGQGGRGHVRDAHVGGPSLAAHGELRRDVAHLARLGSASRSRRRQHRRARSRPRCATLARMEWRERCDRSDGAREALRATVGASEHVAAGAVGTGGRTRRVQRCGQDDPVAPDRRTAATRRRVRSRCWAGSPAMARSNSPASGSLPRMPRSTRG